MSRRGRGGAANNNIRGPTSALTEFLRDAGITNATIARRRATHQQPTPGPSNTDGNVQDAQPAASGSATPASRTSSRRPRRGTSGYASDNLDEDDEPMQVDEDIDEAESIPSPAPTKKRKLTKAAEAKLKAQEKKKAKGKAKKGKGSDDDGYSDDSEDEYTALPKSLWTATSKPPAGSFENCARCEKQFTVTKYTLAANPPPGWLCHVCAKSSGLDPFKKPAPPRKRKAASDKREVITFVENRLPSLVNICVKILTKYIDDVESLGDIGALNLEAIGKAMSKTRSLTSENAKLFYDPKNPTLTFYDATNLTSPAFETLAYLNPNLTSLRLDFCGQLDDKSFKAFCTSLPALRRIELLGPFLVRVDSWKAFAIAHPNIEGFLITQSPRFDLDCMRTLAKHCPGIKELRMKEFARMSDAFLEEIASFSLTYLDISCPGVESCSEAAVINLLSDSGQSLKGLDLAKHDFLTDQFLLDGLLPHVKQLESLNLAHLHELTDEGVAEFFSQWENPPLIELNISRNAELKGQALGAIMKHSGRSLQVLNINGAKDVEESALQTIGRLGKELKKLDVGFCREVDDFLVKAWLEGEDVKGVKRGGCLLLEELKVWGCNKLTAKCPRKARVAIHGVESHIIKMS